VKSAQALAAAWEQFAFYEVTSEGAVVVRATDSDEALV
jgi:hypothetical protein